MKRNYCFYFLMSLISFGCLNKTMHEDVTILKPQIDKANSITLNDLAQEVQIIELDIPEGIFIGNYESIRVVGEYFILHDGIYSHSMLVFDQKGEFISQLYSIGNGPGEYSGCHAFALFENNEKIIVNDRGAKFLIYTFPEFEFITSFEESKYFMSMESLDDSLVLTISDSRFNEDEFIGAELFNIEQKTFHRLQLPAKPGVIDLSYQNTLTKYSDGVYYSSPGFNTSVFDINSETVNKIVKIDFEDFNLPEEVWEWDNPEKAEAVFWGSPKATWVQLFNKVNGSCSFYFLFSATEQKYFSICDLEIFSCAVFKEIFLFNSFSFLPTPIGLFDDYYITFLGSWQIKEFVPEFKAKHIWEKQLLDAKEREKNVLILFKPNFSYDYNYY